DSDTCRPMQHHEIADMFGRRARPRLEVELSFVSISPRFEPGIPAIIFALSIVNNGRGLARFPGLRVIPGDPKCAVPCNSSGQGLDYSSLPLQRRIAKAHDWIFAGGSDHVIHPATALVVCHLRVASTHEGKSDFLCQVFAENMPAADFPFVFTEAGI